MPAIKFGTGAYRRDRGDLPEFELVNMFLEATPSAENGLVLLSRQGLNNHVKPGITGEVRAVFSQPGTYNGDIFSVVGNRFYRGTTQLTTIVGSGPVSIAASATEVLVTAGSTLYSYDGSSTIAVTLPDGFSARAVTIISSTFVVSRSGSDQFYWSALLDGRSWDALDFATAESEPDALLDVITMRGNLYLLGQATIEPWYYSGALELPFALIQQRIFPKGTIATGAAVEMDNALLWIGSDGMVYRTADVPERISNHGIEERIRESSSFSAYGYVYEGHSFFCLRLSSSTFAYDAATQEWNELKSFGRTNFRGRCGAMQDRTALIGDDSTGYILTFTDEYNDNGADLVRQFTGAFPIKGGAVVVDNVTADVGAGHTGWLVGESSQPVVELATSRDAGNTWSEWREASLGEQGNHRARVRWNRLGMFDHPGAMFRFRLSYDANLRVSNVLVNEAGGGRSRAA